jgi:hypothetical protein
MTKVAFNKEKAHQQNGLEFEEVLCTTFGVLLLNGAETWTVQKVDQKHLKSYEMWCWRRMEKISWTDRVRKEVLQRVKEEKNILQ